MGGARNAAQTACLPSPALFAWAVCGVRNCCAQLGRWVGESGSPREVMALFPGHRRRGGRFVPGSAIGGWEHPSLLPEGDRPFWGCFCGFTGMPYSELFAHNWGGGWDSRDSLQGDFLARWSWRGSALRPPVRRTPFVRTTLCLETNKTPFAAYGCVGPDAQTRKSKIDPSRHFVTE